MSPAILRTSRRPFCFLLLGVTSLALSLELATGTQAVPRFPDPMFPVGSEPWDVESADFNGDGIADLVVTNVESTDTEISVLLGRGDGTFLPEARFVSGDGPLAIAVADFNSD